MPFGFAALSISCTTYGRGGRRHRDDRALGKIGEQAAVAIDDGVDFVGVADAEDHEVALLGERRRRIRGLGAGVARAFASASALTSQAVT